MTSAPGDPYNHPPANLRPSPGEPQCPLISNSNEVQDRILWHNLSVHMLYRSSSESLNWLGY